MKSLIKRMVQMCRQLGAPLRRLIARHQQVEQVVLGELFNRESLGSKLIALDFAVKNAKKLHIALDPRFVLCQPCPGMTSSDRMRFSNIEEYLHFRTRPLITLEEIERINWDRLEHIIYAP